MSQYADDLILFLCMILLTSIRCELNTMCTVTGPTVIDFHGQATSVQDRCVYELMTPTDTLNVKILAEFRERRRRDISFLDGVIVQQLDSNVQTVLGQVGKVWCFFGYCVSAVMQVDGRLVTLTSTPHLFNNMMLSQDQTGVTLQISQTYHLSLFFDGNTAQIHIYGPGPLSLQGLCSDSSQLSEMKQVGLSNADCETQYDDTSNITIDCTVMSERCDLLMGAPFTTCNINPEPYIQVCNYTLCRYPAVDGLKCQFMEAYARDCRIRRDVNKGRLEVKRQLASMTAFTESKHNLYKEFFLLFVANSAPFSGGCLGMPTICKENSASVTLWLSLEDLGIDYSALHLKNQTCRGQVDNMTHMVSFSFNGNTCGTVVTANDSHIIYENTIRSEITYGEIVRSEEVRTDFSCFYNNQT
ncbi:uncharacterized protein LOC117505425 [Thalassophryne amazonica]|uniref:uncharacterized protein LOC117505425 n=1 Tax=Thalassophryne amazonica TaxID=390379 RepID=UPI00147259A4|nr:uncharacterized protein LOC117505425 [Thalassophryne amazonica]